LKFFLLNSVSSEFRSDWTILLQLFHTWWVNKTSVFPGCFWRSNWWICPVLQQTDNSQDSYYNIRQTSWGTYVLLGEFWARFSHYGQ